MSAAEDHTGTQSKLVGRREQPLSGLARMRMAALHSPPLKHAYRRLTESAVGHRLAKGTFWSIVGAIASRALTLLSSVLIARMLGREGFGQLAIIQSTVAMFGVFAGFGLGTTATKYVAELRTDDPARAGRIVVLSQLSALVSGGLIGVLLLISARWLADRALGAPELSGYLRLGALLLLLSALNGSQTGALAGFEAFKAIARTSFWSALLSFPLIVGGVYADGLRGAVCGLVASVAVNCALSHIALRVEAAAARVPLAARGCGRELGVLWRFSLPAALSASMVGPVAWACNAMLVAQPNGYVEMGTYSASLTFQNVLLLTASTVGAPLLPMIVSLRSSSNRRLERINMVGAWILCVLLALPLLCVPEVAQALFGADFASQSFTTTFVVVILFTCIMVYKQGLARVLAANNLMWWGLASNAFWGVCLLIAAAFLVRWGALGLAVAYAAAYALNTLVFVPLYTTRHLVPKNTILSGEAAGIWLVLCGLTTLAWFHAPLLVRVLLLPVAIVLIVAVSMRLVTSRAEATP